LNAASLPAAKGLWVDFGLFLWSLHDHCAAVACLVFLFGLALGLDQPKGKSKVKHQTGNSCTMLI